MVVIILAHKHPFEPSVIYNEKIPIKILSPKRKNFTPGLRR